MISPERLRRYPFFAGLESADLKAIVMLTNEIAAQPGETLFEEDQPADSLYFMIDGEIDLHYVVEDVHDPVLHQDFLVGHINPGEPVGISALIGPYRYTATARIAAPTRLLKIDAQGLRALCEQNLRIAATLMKGLAQATMVRLNETRVQLAASRA